MSLQAVVIKFSEIIESPNGLNSELLLIPRAANVAHSQAVLNRTSNLFTSLNPFSDTH